MRRKMRLNAIGWVWWSLFGLLGLHPGYAASPTADPAQVIQELEQALSAVENDLGNDNANAGQLKRAHFTHLVKQYEPIDVIDVIKHTRGKMYFYTEMINLKGTTIKHRWEYQGKVMAEVQFPVTAALYRVHSSKNIPPTAFGEWTVVVTDDSGQVLVRKVITVVK